MTNSYRSPLLISIFGLMMIALTSCLPNNEEVQRAFLNLTVQFTDSGSMTPVSDTRIDIFAQFATADDSFYQGDALTNENGVIDGFLDSPDEATLTKLTFIINANDEEFTVEEEVDVQFHFEEPYESVDLLIEVPITESSE